MSCFSSYSSSRWRSCWSGIEEVEREREREMEKPWLKLEALSISVNLMLSLMMMVSEATESPQYTVVHSESEFEIRFYRDSVWMSAPVNDLSFHQATKFGFHRLFQYIQGANLNFSRIPMTKPVLTSIVPGAGPLHSSAYVVHFYLPMKSQETPPLPLPELNLKPVSWLSHCVAVRKFSGFARDGNVVKEAGKLATSLGRSPWANSTSADRNMPTQLLSMILHSGSLDVSMKYGSTLMVLNPIAVGQME